MDGCRADGQALRGPLARVCCSRQLAPLSAGISALFVISSVASRSFHLFLAVAAYRTYPRRWAGHCAGNAQQHSSHSGCTRPPFLPLISFFVSRACLNLLSFLFPQIVAAIAWSQASRRLLMVGLYQPVLSIVIWSTGTFVARCQEPAVEHCSDRQVISSCSDPIPAGLCFA